MLREMATRQSQTSPLTPRQRAILQRVAQGLSSKEIASEFGLSVKTVVNHRHEIRRRLGLTSVASLTRYAVEQGLIEAPSLGDV
jgi:DNA-binding CsgD family transcriptional regulator